MMIEAYKEGVPDNGKLFPEGSKTVKITIRAGDEATRWRGGTRVRAALEKEHDMDALRNVLTRLETEGAALGHFNVSDLVMLKGVHTAAGQIGVPVLVGASEGERDFFGVRQLAVVVNSLREESDVPIFLNVDHTHSLAKAVDATKAGFDEIIVDFSALPFEQDVLNTKEALEAIKAINPAILVEGEIGDIGTGSEIHEKAQGEFKKTKHSRRSEAVRPIDWNRCPRTGRRQYARHGREYGGRQNEEALGY